LVIKWSIFASSQKKNIPLPVVVIFQWQNTKGFNYPDFYFSYLQFPSLNPSAKGFGQSLAKLWLSKIQGTLQILQFGWFMAFYDQIPTENP
jgi:hypothetical protein